jgi:hypothetical protein
MTTIQTDPDFDDDSPSRAGSTIESNEQMIAAGVIAALVCVHQPAP